jgi:hypothetical protein
MDGPVRRCIPLRPGMAIDGSAKFLKAVLTMEIEHDD